MKFALCFLIKAWNVGTLFWTNFGPKTGLILTEDLFFGLHLIWGRKADWFWVEKVFFWSSLFSNFLVPPFRKSWVRYCTLKPDNNGTGASPARGPGGRALPPRFLFLPPIYFLPPSVFFLKSEHRIWFRPEKAFGLWRRPFFLFFFLGDHLLLAGKKRLNFRFRSEKAFGFRRRPFFLEITWFSMKICLNPTQKQWKFGSSSTLGFSFAPLISALLPSNLAKLATPL